MRTVSLWALALLTLTALGVFPSTTCGESPLGCYEIFPRLLLLVLLGFLGLILALIATIQGIVRTVKQRQWGWCVGLGVGFLAPFPAGLFLYAPFVQVFGPFALLDGLPLCVGLALTPVVALLYSVWYPRRMAAEPSSPLVPLPSAESLGETAPPALDAP